MSDANDYNTQLIAEFRANEGKLGGPLAGAPMMLITTTGAKSGQPRTAPLMYTTDGDRFVIIASKGGAPTNPDWYHNIVANPEIIVEIGGETFPARAEIAVEPERTRLFDAHAALMPGFREYQNNTTRVIPVVTISRA